MTSAELRVAGIEAYPVAHWADALHVHPLTLRRAISSGKLACYRVGRACRITERQITDYLERSVSNG